MIHFHKPATMNTWHSLSIPSL